ncbi:MAG: hypothetical protein IIC10_09345 [Proteobacteria bacterium]|nr:hypothetical protein [Pseudomonadota bacterium]
MRKRAAGMHMGIARGMKGQRGGGMKGAAGRGLGKIFGKLGTSEGMHPETLGVSNSLSRQASKKGRVKHGGAAPAAGNISAIYIVAQDDLLGVIMDVAAFN